MADPVTFDSDLYCGATDEDYRSMLADLLPSGPVCSRDPDSRLQQLLLALAADFAGAHNRSCDLIRESIPTDAMELLPDWERLIGPDRCAPGGPSTLDARRRRIVARLNYRGGQSIAIFRDLALVSFGVELCFAEFRPFRAAPNGPTPGLVTGYRLQSEFYGHAGARRFGQDPGGDAGIDLVAETFDGALHTVQAKFYAEDAVLRLEDMGGFFAASSVKRFSHRLVVLTNARVSDALERAFADQSPCPGLSGISCMSVHNGFEGDHPWHDGKLRLFRMHSWINCSAGLTRGAPLTAAARLTS